MGDIKKFLLLSQISLVGFLLICCLIIPSVVTTNGGVSNFGNHNSTVELYILGFTLSPIFLWMTARKMLSKSSNISRLANSLILLGVLELLVLISTFPRHINYTFSEIHDYIGIVLFTYEFIISVFLVLKNKNLSSLLFLLIEAIGSIVGLLSVLKVIHLLFIGQFIGTIGFSILLVTTFPKVAQDSLKN